MGPLTSTPIRLLTKILSGPGSPPANKDALRFRASNEDALNDLDKREREGILLRSGNKYFVSILALTELRSKSPEADSVLHLCVHLFDAVRRLYKEDPGRQLAVDEVARVADLPSAIVQKGLGYLTQAPIWSTSASDHAGLVISAQPSEDILRYKDLDDVIDEMRARRKRTNERVEAREARDKQQKFRILDALLFPARPHTATD
jgi:hypothetical protein